MLKTILSISGKPGLFRLVSQGKNMLIVESLMTKKRTPAYAHDKVVSLGDIAIYTIEEEVPLSQVMQTIYDKEKGAVDVSVCKSEKTLREFFESVLPTYDEERVYLTDIKKVVAWYNLLVEAGFTSFVSEKKEEQPAENEEEK